MGAVSNRGALSSAIQSQPACQYAPSFDDRLGSLYTTAVALGMRQGELLALRWSDLDFDAGTISIRHTLRRGVRTLGEPKTDGAKRTPRMGDMRS